MKNTKKLNIQPANNSNQKMKTMHSKNNLNKGKLKAIESKGVAKTITSSTIGPAFVKKLGDGTKKLKSYSKDKNVPLKYMEKGKERILTANNTNLSSLKKTKEKYLNKRLGSNSENKENQNKDKEKNKDIDNEDDSLIELPKAATVSSKNIKVFIRFRPLNDLEVGLLNDSCGWMVPKYISDSTIGIYSSQEIKDNKYQMPNNYVFKYDKVFKCDSRQSEIYESVGKRIVDDVMEGYNGTIFAYGQSGSGKTYTMYGPDLYDEGIKGIIPRILEDIFNYVQKADDNIDFQFKLSVLEIYKEVMYDLISPENELKILENPATGVWIDGISEIYLSSVDEFFDYAELSQSNRKVAETKLNHNSSRSHCIMILEVTQSFRKEKLIKKGTLNLVDLAGSEKISKTGAVGETLEEAKKINLSLSTLGNVIHALTHKAEHIPYRDSKLTRILKESLGGNFKTSLIVTCSPHSYNLDEIISSLLFAKRVKTIKNKVKVNIKYSYEELQKMVNLLNQKLQLANSNLRRAINGEKIDIDSLKRNSKEDNEDNIECSNCNLLRKEKNLLEDKVQKLLDTINEKDIEIARLKSFINSDVKIKQQYIAVTGDKDIDNFHSYNNNISPSKQKGQGITFGVDGNNIRKSKKGKKGNNDDSDAEVTNAPLKGNLKNKKWKNKKNVNNIETNKNDDKDSQNNSLFEAGEDAKTDKVYNLYKKVKEKLSKIQDENARINIIQNEEEELRKIKIKIDEYNKILSEFIKNNDKTKCFEKMDQLTKISIPLVKNIDYSKGLSEYKENLTNIFEKTFGEKRNEIFEASDKELVDLFSVSFFYEYLRFYFSHQIVTQGYRKLILDNRSLHKMNIYLFDIVRDILSVNFDIANDNVINANALNLLKASLVGDSFVGQVDQKELESVYPTKKVMLKFGNDINQKIIKMVSRKNLTIKNSFVSPYKMSLLIPDKSVTNSFAGGNENDPRNSQAPIDKTKVNPSIISFNPEANIALINKIKSQETEKSASKLQMIRNVLISVIKETDKIRNNVKEFKDYINNIINLNMNFFNKKILKSKDSLYIVNQLKPKENEDILHPNIDGDNDFGEMKIGVKQQDSEENSNEKNLGKAFYSSVNKKENDSNTKNNNSKKGLKKPEGILNDSKLSSISSLHSKTKSGANQPEKPEIKSKEVMEPNTTKNKILKNKNENNLEEGTKNSKKTQKGKMKSEVLKQYQPQANISKKYKEVNVKNQEEGCKYSQGGQNENKKETSPFRSQINRANGDAGEEINDFNPTPNIAKGKEIEKAQFKYKY